MNLEEVLNTIYDNASDIYRERIPVATQNNITEIRDAMLDGDNIVVANEFMSTLLNLIIKQVIHNKLFTNPLKSLKQGTKPLGDTIEEIYSNFIKAETYDQTGANLLQRKLPDTKTAWHRMNRKDKYKVTINHEELYKAFSSYEKLGSYITSIINSLVNSSELDEYVLTKQLIKEAYDNNAIKVVNIKDPLTSDTNAKDFIKTIKTISGDMVFPNSNNNAYLEAQSTDTKPIVTFSRKNEQVLIIDNATDVSVAVDVLASTFNMSVADFNDTRKIVIDAFPIKGARAALVDEQFFQIYDDLMTFKEFENGEGLYKNYYLHVWQTISYSILVNAVLFMVSGDSDSDGEVESYNVTYTLKSGVTSSNKRKKVSEGSSYSTTLNGVSDTDNVVVTMGGTTLDDVYVNGSIYIENVTGNIVINVS